MRVLVVTSTTAQIGGAEVVQAALLDGLVAGGHEVAIVAERDTPAALYQGRLDLKAPRDVATAGWRARRWSPDVVLCERPSVLPAASAISRLSRCPLVFHAHDLPPAWVGAWQMRSALAHTSTVIAVSEFAAARWRLLARRVEVVHNGTGPRSPSLGSQPPLVLFLGRFVRDKGIDVLLDAWPSVKGARLRLVGATEADGEVTARAERLGVEVNGWTANVAPHVNEADVVAVPSVYEEPFGMVVLEALAAHTPAVATSNGGLPEVVGDDLPALLVPPGDAVALAATLNSVVRWRTDDPQLGLRCADQAAKFTVEAMVDRAERVLRAARR